MVVRQRLTTTLLAQAFPVNKRFVIRNWIFEKPLHFGTNLGGHALGRCIAFAFVLRRRFSETRHNW